MTLTNDVRAYGRHRALVTPHEPVDCLFQALAEQQRAQQLVQQPTTGAAQTPGAPAQTQVAVAGLQTAAVTQGNQQGVAAVPNTAVLVRLDRV